MQPTNSSWPQTLSVKVYIRLLKLYPTSYQEKFALDMERTFSDCCRFTFQERGVIGLLRLWMPTIADLSLSVLDKHLDEGLLSSGVTMMRAISFAMLAGATALYMLAWDSGIGVLVLATLLLVLGALGAFFTSNEGKDLIKRRLSMSDSIVQFPPELQDQTDQRNEEAWHLQGPEGRNFLLRWIPASAVGLIVGFAVYFSLVVNFAADLALSVQLLLSVVGGIIFGVSIGITQWLVLRGLVSRSGQWFVASTAGGTVGGLAARFIRAIMGEDSGFHVALTVGVAVVGVSLGIAGWLVLRRHVSRAGWWVLASTVGMLVALALSNILGRFLYDALLGVLGEGISKLLTFLIFGGLLLTGYGTITGAVLAWLLRQAPTQTLNPSQADS